MSTVPPISSFSPSGNDHLVPTVKVGNSLVVCFDAKQKELTEASLSSKNGIGNLKVFAPFLKEIEPEKVDASPTTIFTLTQGIQALLPGQHLHSFHDAEDMVKQVDPTNGWLERAGPDGRGDTLKEFATNVQETLAKMGMNPAPSVKVEHVTFKPENLTQQHSIADQFRTVMSQLASPPHGKHNIVIVNCDQALAINGATQSKVPQGEFGGNYCIVGGFDRDSDRVLLLDLDKSYPAEGTTPAKNSGIYWVPLSDLVDAMNTRDEDAKMNRGYLSFSISTN